MTKRFTRAKLAAAAIALAAAFPAAPAFADATDFLSAFEGQWRGSGQARLKADSEPTRVSCRFDTTFDAAQARLQNRGKCGSTQGSRNVSGTVTANGNSVSGTFIGGDPTEKVIEQTTRLNGDVLVSEVTLQGRQKVTRLRTAVSRPVDGQFTVTSEAFDFQSRTWKNAAQMDFRRQ